MSDLEQHIKEADIRFGQIDCKLDRIMDNHLAHIQQSIKEIEVSMAGIKLTVGGITKGLWYVVAPILGAIGVALVGIIIVN